jgi:hypothetical protein
MRTGVSAARPVAATPSIVRLIFTLCSLQLICSVVLLPCSLRDLQVGEGGAAHGSSLRLLHTSPPVRMGTRPLPRERRFPPVSCSVVACCRTFEACPSLNHDDPPPAPGVALLRTTTLTKSPAITALSRNAEISNLGGPDPGVFATAVPMGCDPPADDLTSTPVLTTPGVLVEPTPGVAHAAPWHDRDEVEFWAALVATLGASPTGGQLVCHEAPSVLQSSPAAGTPPINLR